MKHARFPELAPEIPARPGPQDRMRQATARIPRGVLIALLLVVATIVIRLPWIGDATYHEDESFYLVFAKAMHQGAVPYVDIWDRKPFGLFLLYWLFTCLPGSGIVAEQCASGLFAAATAWCIYRIARLLGSERGAICSALAYLACTPVILGAGGQAPIFYNLFVAAAALLVVSPIAGERPLRDRIYCGGLAMLCCGIALTMKPTTVVESIFLGLAAAYHVLIRREARLSTRMLTVLGFIAIGALPTMLIWGYFLSIGQFPAYWFATVLSIALKPAQSAAITQSAVLYLSLVLAPFWILSAATIALVARMRPHTHVTRFLLAWTFAAFGGFFTVPNFWDHYALPLLPPLVILMSTLFARRISGTLAIGMILLWAMLLTGWPFNARAREANAQLDQVMRTIERERRGGCVYVYEGAPVIYAMTDACRVTSRIFPQHLDFSQERDAIGLDAAQEMRRILARRPAIIVRSNRPLVKPTNLETKTILESGLQTRYRKVAVLPLSESNKPRYKVEIWRLDDAVAARSTLGPAVSHRPAEGRPNSRN